MSSCTQMALSTMLTAEHHSPSANSTAKYGMTTPIGAQQHPLSTPKSGPSKRQSKLSRANQAQHVPISSATIKLLPMPSSILMSNQIKWSLCTSTCCFANGSRPAPTSLDIIRKVLSRLGPVTWSYCNGHDSLASTRRSFSGLEFGYNLL